MFGALSLFSGSVTERKSRHRNNHSEMCDEELQMTSTSPTGSINYLFYLAVKIPNYCNMSNSLTLSVMILVYAKMR